MKVEMLYMPKAANTMQAIIPMATKYRVLLVVLSVLDFIM
jgi:hypothetical protein